VATSLVLRKPQSLGNRPRGQRMVSGDPLDLNTGLMHSAIDLHGFLAPGGRATPLCPISLQAVGLYWSIFNALAAQPAGGTQAQYAQPLRRKLINLLLPMLRGPKRPGAFLNCGVAEPHSAITALWAPLSQDARIHRDGRDGVAIVTQCRIEGYLVLPLALGQITDQIPAQATLARQHQQRRPPSDREHLEYATLVASGAASLQSKAAWARSPAMPFGGVSNRIDTPFSSVALPLTDTPPVQHQGCDHHFIARQVPVLVRADDRYRRGFKSPHAPGPLLAAGQLRWQRYAKVMSESAGSPAGIAETVSAEPPRHGGSAIGLSPKTASQQQYQSPGQDDDHVQQIGANDSSAGSAAVAKYGDGIFSKPIFGRSRYVHRFPHNSRPRPACQTTE